MTLNKWLSAIREDNKPLFNGMYLIPIILSVTLAFEGVTQEDSPLIASKTYAESESASEDKDVSITSLYQSYHLSLGISDYTPLPYSGLTVKGASDSNRNVWDGTGAFDVNGRGSKFNNTAMGYNVMYSADENANNNIAYGDSALYSITNGDDNSALGYQSLYSNTTGSGSVALGYKALYSNTTESNNTAIGYEAAKANTTGSRTVAVGYQSLLSNTTGDNNTAIGYESLRSNTTGTSNSGLGRWSLYSNTTGSNNTAAGSRALYSNPSGYSNSAY